MNKAYSWIYCGANDFAPRPPGAAAMATAWRRDADRSFESSRTPQVAATRHFIIPFDIIKLCGHQQPLKHEVLWPHKWFLWPHTDFRLKFSMCNLSTFVFCRKSHHRRTIGPRDSDQASTKVTISLHNSKNYLAGPKFFLKGGCWGRRGSETPRNPRIFKKTQFWAKKWLSAHFWEPIPTLRNKTGPQSTTWT